MQNSFVYIFPVQIHLKSHHKHRNFFSDFFPIRAKIYESLHGKVELIVPSYILCFLIFLSSCNYYISGSRRFSWLFPRTAWSSVSNRNFFPSTKCTSISSSQHDEGSKNLTMRVKVNRRISCGVCGKAWELMKLLIRCLMCTWQLFRYRFCILYFPTSPRQTDRQTGTHIHRNNPRDVYVFAFYGVFEEG